MRIIEGTVDEIIEYQKKLGPGLLGSPVVEEDDIPVREPAPARRAGRSDDNEEEEIFFIHQFVYRRATDAGVARRVLQYVHQVFALSTYVESGASERSADGLADYLMVRDDGPKKFGAVAYVRPSNGGMTLRLRPEDVRDINDEHIKLRNVAANQQYAVNCPLHDDDAVEIALELTKRALRKVRSDEKAED